MDCMNQISFDDTSSNIDSKSTLSDLAIKALKTNNFDCSVLEIKENVNKGTVIGYSLYYDSSLILKVDTGFTMLSADKKLLNNIEINNYLECKEMNISQNYLQYTFSAFSNEYIKLLSDILNTYIVSYMPQSRFGCCHRYIECSDAKKCLAPDQAHARGCYYRENLEQGKIFYGKNKNT